MRRRAPTRCRSRRNAGGGRGRRRAWGEVEAVDAFALDQPECVLGIPRRLGDEAPADDRGGEQRVDAHRVVEGHDAEGPMSRAEPVLEHLRRCLRRARRGASAGRPSAVRWCPTCRAGSTARARRDRVRPDARRWRRARAPRRIADDDLGAAVPDAVVEVGLGDAVRERHEDGAEPLAGPVELDRLGLVREHARDPVAGLDAARSETAGDPRRALAQLRVRQPRRLADERLRVGGSARPRRGG